LLRVISKKTPNPNLIALAWFFKSEKSTRGSVPNSRTAARIPAGIAVLPANNGHPYLICSAISSGIHAGFRGRQSGRMPVRDLPKLWTIPRGHGG
jgi:hypothetical protein